MSLYLRGKLPFESNIMFKEFLPERKDEGIQFSLKNGRYNILVYLSDRGSQLHMVSDIPTDPEELKRYQNLFCDNLTIEIEAFNPEKDILEALEKGSPNEKTEEFGKEILNIILQTHNGIINFFRDIAKQYWISPIIIDTRNYQNLLDFTFEVKWYSPTNEWKRFNVSRKNVIHLTGMIHENGVNKEMWKDISVFITKNNGIAPMLDTLISNSFQLISQNNSRLAVIEAVSALEHCIKLFLPRILFNLSSKNLSIDEHILNKLMHRAGLSLLIKWGLKLIQPSLNIKDEDIQICLDTIGQRKNIIHGAMREMSIEKAGKYISTIARIVKTLRAYCY